VLLLEAEAAFGTGTSSRNSEVMHAGLYYPAGSLKALLCVRGRHLLADFCASHGVAHQRCGKLIVVATRPTNCLKLDQIRWPPPHANGVHDLQPLTQAQAQALEPELHCVAALHSPSSGIVDSHGLMNALLGDAQAAGALFAVASPLLSAQRLADGWRVHTGGDEAFELRDCSWLVNSRRPAGAAVARDARLSGIAATSRATTWPRPLLHPARPAPFRRLVYPTPVDGGLGVHLTLDLGGQARFGPDVQWLPTTRRLDYASTRRWAGLRGRHPPLLARPARGHAAAGLCRHPAQAQRPGASRRPISASTARRAWRAGVVQLFGIESPGLTSSLAIAEHVAALVRG
jgi:L-2-hydroxyglutarate oxidase LhgO